MTNNLQTKQDKKWYESITAQDKKEHESILKQDKNVIYHGF